MDFYFLLYDFEALLFGITSDRGILTPNEYLNLNQTVFLDLLSGMFYINWMPVPILFGIYLFFNDRWFLLNFNATFCVVNTIGFLIYYVFPAAPPWYFELYGDVENFQTASNAAGLLRFDEFFGINLFQDIYTKGSNVFAALPSMHSAYPLIVLFYSYKLLKHHWFTWLMVLFSFGTWFAAVYSSHHYILDVILGVICAIIGIWVYEKFLLKTKFKNWLEIYFEKRVR
jgi:membrane-associated phospholipid phosphatase